MRLSEVGSSLIEFLNRPQWVLFLSAGFFLLHMMVHGTPGKLMGLNAEIKRLNTEVKALNVQISALDHQLIRAKDPDFVERSAKDQLDMAGEDDLVFTFADEGP
jgi:cell division protein FtsB